MKPNQKTVISASRRTDIPALYMKWFMVNVNKGRFEVMNPYNRHVSIVPATPDKVHTIVFWSKNFGPFIEGGYGEALTKMGFNLFFNVTLNSDLSLLEPNIPAIAVRIAQLRHLSSHYSVDSINWRFDPICFFRFGDSEIQNNLADFQMIARNASRLGIGRCITSFMDHYPKIRRRTRSKPGFSFIDPPLEKKKTLLLWMEQILDNENIKLQTCCEKEVLDALPLDTGITNSSCIPNDLLVKIFGGRLSLKKDAGQRIKQGCGCMDSVDIGSYHQHPCYHNCLFCYANPSSSRPEVSFLAG